MRKTGLGLKPLIALHLVVVLGVAGSLLGYTASRLIRHGLTMEQVRWARAFLRGAARNLPALCPDLVPGGGCHRLPGWAREQRETLPALREISVLDEQGNLAATTDPALTAGALWDAFGARVSGGGPEQDWSIWERDERRVVVVQLPAGAAGWTLRGSFSLEESDAAAAGLTRSLYLYAALVVAVMLLAGWLLLHRLIVRPVERLLQSADRISEGDLHFLLSPDRGSELGRLGFSLTRMARRIEDDQRKLRDQITELTRLNRELHQAQQGLVRSEKLASVGRLAAGVAHEVGNPISAILGYVGMLRSEAIPEQETRDILGRVEREVERIDRVIQDLLSYSRPGRGAVGRVRPAELAEDAMALLRPQKRYKEVTVEVEVGGDLPAVRADPDLLRQVLVNLLLNALDAVGAGGHIWLRAVVLESDGEGGMRWPGHEDEPPFFALGAVHRIRPPGDGRGIRPGEPVVVFAVADDGEGIPEADLVRIFDPFFTSKDPGRGTGLGLAICHAGVNAMGGEIWAWSKPGEGAQLAFTLPVEAAEL